MEKKKRKEGKKGEEGNVEKKGFAMMLQSFGYEMRKGGAHISELTNFYTTVYKMVVG